MRLKEQFFEQLGDVAVDVLGTIIAMKTEDFKGKLNSSCPSTRIRYASLMRSHVATTSNCVTQSTALPW